MKRVLLLLFMCMFMISSASALDIDNWVNYEDDDMKVRITNALNFGEDLGTAELKSHKSVNQALKVAAGKDIVTMYYDFNFKETYNNGLGEVYFINMSSGEYIEKDYHFVIWDKIYKEKNNYLTECNDVYSEANSSYNEICENVLIGTYIEETEGWVNLNTKDIPKGKVRIGLATDVNVGDTVDGVWTIAGKKVDRHAVWTEDLNVGLESYYKLDEQDTSGSGTIINQLGINATNNGADNSTGKIETAYDFEFDNVDFINTNTGAGAGEYLDFTVNFTIAGWIKMESLPESNYNIVGKRLDSSNYQYVFRISSAGDKLALLTTGGAITSTGASLSTGVWYHVAIVYNNGGNTLFYIDGSLDDTITSLSISHKNSDVYIGYQEFVSANQAFDGLIDELGLWNRSLSTLEINKLWNNGDGITFPDSSVVSEVNVELIAPEDEELVSSNVTLTSNITTNNDLNLTNATIFVWDSNKDIFFTQSNTTIFGNFTEVSFIVRNLTQGTYEWNVVGVAENATGYVFLNFSANNNTFTWVPFDIDNETFNNNVFETSTQYFLVNVTTLPSVLALDAILNYNGTRFTTDTSCSSGLCEVSTAINIPLVTSGESQNKSFFWEISIFDGTNSFSTNLTANEQNVTRLHLEECNATFTIQTLNFTSFDEETQSAVDPFMFDGSFDFWLGTGTVKRNKSISNSSISSLQLCLLPSSETLLLDGTVEYDEASGTNYTNRNYFFQSDTINNVSEDIRLGLLLAEDSTSFILKVQDRDILPVANVLIFTERFYPGEGIFKVVQVSETDENGRTVGFFQTETVEYRFILKQNSTTVLTTNKQKIVGESVPFTLTFTIGEDEGAAWESFEDIDDLTSDVFFNKTSNIASFTYTDTSGDFALGRLVVEKVNASGLQNTIICSETSVESSAIITCNLTGNSTGQYIMRGIITRNSEATLVNQEPFAIEDFSTVSGRLGLFLGWFIILISVFAFKYNEVAGIILVNLAIIMVNLIGLISFGYVFISAMVAISIIILVVLER